MVENIKNKILLVEDEALVAMLEKKQLESYNYSVLHVSKGEDAVTKALSPEGHFDLILMDIDLGKGIDGTEAASLILKKINIPIVFLSSHTEPDIVEKTEKITSYGYIVKGAGITVLDASIKMAFKLFKANRESHKSELFFSQLFEQAIVSTQLLDAAGNTIRVNSTFCKLFGVTAEDMVHYKIFEDEAIKESNAYAPLMDVYENKIPRRWHNQFDIAHASESTGVKTTRPKTVFLENLSYPILDKENNLQHVVIQHFDITERKQVEEEIKKQLIEKETLLREVHHRVKNNITNIESFLMLQNDSTSNPEVKEAINGAISRVKSMRILYEKILISGDPHEISIKNYIETLVDSLHDVYSDKDYIIIEKQFADFSVSSKKAISIGIMINELITNVFKHAFIEQDKGTVSIVIKKIDNKVTVIIKDNGIGIDEKVIENKASGFGLTIVKMLVEQFDGTYNAVNENGTKSTIQFEI